MRIGTGSTSRRRQYSKVHDMNSHEQRDVVVVGAGILGLATANMLQRTLPKSTRISLVAAEFPTTSPMLGTASKRPESKTGASADYASMWAGAHYRPIPFLPVSSVAYEAASPEQKRLHQQLAYEAGLALRTAGYMLKLARERTESGVQIVPAAEYLESPAREHLLLQTGDIYASDEDDFRVLSETEIESLNAQAGVGKIAWACQYNTYVVNVHMHCAWLLEQFRTGGGRVVQKACIGLDDAFHMHDDRPFAPLVINCSGRNFDRDPKVKIIRGQTVLVKNFYHSTITRQNKDGSWSFLIPRPCGGGTVIGGTKEIGDSEERPRAETRQQLLENAAKYFPDFVSRVEDFEVVCDNVGRRPWREGGLRIEVEDRRFDDEDQRFAGQTGKVVHGYGAGGRGFELSHGIAEEVCRLVEKCNVVDTTAKL